MTSIFLQLLTICTNSTFSLLQEMGLQKLWLEFGQGKAMPVHDIVSRIGNGKSKWHFFFFMHSLVVIYLHSRAQRKKIGMANMDVLSSGLPYLHKSSLSL